MSILMKCDHEGCTITPWSPDENSPKWFSVAIEGADVSGERFAFCSIPHLVDYMRNGGF